MADEWDQYVVKPAASDKDEWDQYAVKKKVSTPVSKSGAGLLSTGSNPFQPSQAPLDPTMLTPKGLDEYSMEARAQPKKKPVSYTSLVKGIQDYRNKRGQAQDKIDPMLSEAWKKMPASSSEDHDIVLKGVNKLFEVAADATPDRVKNAWTRGQLQGEVANLLPLQSAPTEESLMEIARLNQIAENIPESEELRKLNEGGLRWAFSNKLDGAKALGEIILSSLSAQLKASERTTPTAVGIGAGAGSAVPGIGTAAGVVSGLTAGQVLAGMNLETSGKVLDVLKEAGFDTADGESLVEAFKNPKLVDKARDLAIKRGLPIAVLDLLSAGLGGRIASRTATSLAGKVAKTGAVAGVEALGGSTGEALAQVASGEEFDINSVALEGIAELGAGAPALASETYGNVRDRNKTSSSDTNIIKQVVADKETGVIEANQNLDTQLQDGLISPEQHAEGKALVEKIVAVDAKIPEKVEGEAREKSIELIAKKEDVAAEIKELEETKKATDEVYHEPIDGKIERRQAKVEEINAELKELAVAKPVTEEVIAEEDLMLSLDDTKEQSEEKIRKNNERYERRKAAKEAPLEIEPLNYEEEADIAPLNYEEEATTEMQGIGDGSLEKKRESVENELGTKLKDLVFDRFGNNLADLYDGKLALGKQQKPSDLIKYDLGDDFFAIGYDGIPTNDITFKLFRKGSNINIGTVSKGEKGGNWAVSLNDEAHRTYANKISEIFDKKSPSNEQAPTPTEATEQVLPKQGVTVEENDKGGGKEVKAPDALTKAETDLASLKQSKDKAKKYTASMKRLSEAKQQGQITEAEFNATKERFDDVMAESSGKAGDSLRKLADKIDKGKISKPGELMSSTGFTAVWDGSLTVVSASLRASAGAVDAIEVAIEAGLAYARDTDWYRNLKDKPKFEETYRNHLTDQLNKKSESGSNKKPASESEEAPKNNDLSAFINKNIESDEIRETLSNAPRESGREFTQEEKDYRATKLLDALKHGDAIIAKAQEIFGKDYVSELLGLLSGDSFSVDKKVLTLVSLENSLEKQLLESPSDVTLLKQLKLVRNEAVKLQRTAAIATAYGRIRQLARLGYDIENITDSFLSPKQQEARQKLTEAIESTVDDINEEAEAQEQEQEITEPKKPTGDKLAKAREKVKKAKSEFDSFIKASRSSAGSFADVATFVAKAAKLMKAYAELGIVKLEDVLAEMRKDYGDAFVTENEDLLTQAHDKANGVVTPPTPQEIAAKKLEQAKKNVQKRIDVLNKEIADRQRTTKKSSPVTPDAELTTLINERDALTKVRDRELPAVTTTASQIKTQVTRLTREIEYLDEQIANGSKTVKGKNPPLTSAEIDALKAKKQARVDVLNYLDPDLKEATRQGLIEAGYGREITVNTKAGKVKKKILDWKKLAGEEGSIANIQEKVEAYLAGKGYSPGDISRMSAALATEFTDLRASIVAKSLAEIDRLNKETAPANHTSAAKRLAQLYDMGLFDQNRSTYDRLINRAVGLSLNAQEAFDEAKSLAESMSMLLNSKDATGKKYSDLALSKAIRDIQAKQEALVTKIVNSEANVAYKLANTFAEFMSMGQRFVLASLNQLIENPLSGYVERAIQRIGAKVTGQADTKELSDQRAKLSKTQLADILLNAGNDFGGEKSLFISKSQVMDMLNGLSDSQTYHVTTSVVLARAYLEAADSMHKIALTQRAFIENAVKVLMAKGKTKQEAINFISEALTGQSFEQAEAAAKTIIADINAKAGKTVLPDNKQSVTLLANDIVKDNLLKAGGLTEHELRAAHKAGYAIAGYGMGHVPNNLLSTGVKLVNQYVQNKLDKAVKDKNWSVAAAHRMTNAVFNTVLNPFVGGGSNWTVLTLTKLGLNPLAYISAFRKSKIDVNTFTGQRNLEHDLTLAGRRRTEAVRVIVGATFALSLYAATRFTGADDELEEWLEENPVRAKFIKKAEPAALMLIMARDAAAKGDDKAMDGFFKDVFRLREHDVFSDSKKMYKAVQVFSPENNTEYEEAMGAIGQLTLGKVNAPVPSWRVYKDFRNIYLELSGRSPSTTEYGVGGYFNGVFQGGFTEYAGMRPNKEVLMYDDKTGDERPLSSKEKTRYNSLVTLFTHEDVEKNQDKIAKMTPAEQVTHLRTVTTKASKKALELMSGFTSESSEIQIGAKKYVLSPDQVRHRVKLIKEYMDKNEPSFPDKTSLKKVANNMSVAKMLSEGYAPDAEGKYKLQVKD